MDSSPHMFMVALVDNDVFNGNIARNLFHFKNYNLNKFDLYRDGKAIPGQSFQPDFAKNRYFTCRSFIQTMQSFNYWHTDDTNGLTVYEWAMVIQFMH